MSKKCDLTGSDIIYERGLYVWNSLVYHTLGYISQNSQLDIELKNDIHAASKLPTGYGRFVSSSLNTQYNALQFFMQTIVGHDFIKNSFLN